MVLRRPVAALVAVACCPAAGCLAVYSTRPVDVLVTSTDTGRPAAGVPVEVTYGYMLVLNPPANTAGTTDAEGRVTLPLADFLAGPRLQVGTAGYAVGPEVVQAGGRLEYKPSAHPEELVPAYSVRLVPRRRSLSDRLLGRPGESGSLTP